MVAISYYKPMKAVTYSKAAIKTLRKMPADEARRVRGKIGQYAADPESQARNVTALKGSPYVRLRVGDWRIIMDDQGAVLDVLKIGARGGVYE